MKKVLLIITGALLMGMFGFAQNETDALRYSYLVHGGTARFTSMAGAFGALGGDFSTITTNPAGLGVYRRQLEVSFSPAFDLQNVESTFNGNRIDDSKNNLNIGGLGLVYTAPLNSLEWRSFTFGVGINQLANFNRRQTIEGSNSRSSLMTDFLHRANQQGSVANLSDYSTGLAWDTWLLGQDDNGFFIDLDDNFFNNGGSVFQRQRVISSGYLNEFSMAVAGNYKDRLFIGATVGIPIIKYNETTTFFEEYEKGPDDIFNSLNYDNSLAVTGTGINLKIGAILRLSDMVRVGASLHTPTLFSIEEIYDASMRSDLNLDSPDYNNFAQPEKRGLFRYELSTPLKASASLGLVFGTAGLLSLEYEYVNFAGTKLRSDDHTFTNENTVISQTFTKQHNLKVGGEVNLFPLVLRGGLGYYPSPLNNGQVSDQMIVSAGVGFRSKHYFLDFGFSRSVLDSDFYIYDSQFVNAAKLGNTNQRFIVTAGYRL
jgi:hypothetical protein